MTSRLKALVRAALLATSLKKERNRPHVILLDQLKELQLHDVQRLLVDRMKLIHQMRTSRQIRLDRLRHYYQHPSSCHLDAIGPTKRL